MGVLRVGSSRERGRRSLGSGRGPAVAVAAVVLVTFVLAAVVLALALGSPIAVGSGGVVETIPDAVWDSANAVDVDEELESAEGAVEVVVRLEELEPPADADDEEIERLRREHADESQRPVLEYAEEREGVTVETVFWVTNAVVLTVDADRVAFEEFAAFEDIYEIHPNDDLPPPDLPEPVEPDPPKDDRTGDRPDTTWGIDAIDAPAVWEEYDTRGEGVKVAVLDTGVDADHPDVDLYTSDPSDPTYPGGWAEFDDTGDRVEGSIPHDSTQHGTHVSATVAGGNASGTFVGVAPDAELLHGKVLSEEGGSFARIVAGMEWAIEEDADVLSMSLGVNGTQDRLIDPVRNAREQGVPVVAAVGNEGPETSGSPGNVYDAVGVGATDPNGDVASFSGGEEIDRERWSDPPEEWPESYVTPDVVAPGVFVESAVPGGGYEHFHGTSMATPHASGTIGLLLAIEPDATPEELETAIYDSTRTPADAPSEDADTRSKDTRYGYGILDASGAAETLVRIHERPTAAGSDDSDGVDDDLTPDESADGTSTAASTIYDALRNLSPAALVGWALVTVSVVYGVWLLRRRRDVE